MFAQYKLIIIGIAVLALIGSVTAWVIGYGSDKYDEGVKKTEAAWALSVIESAEKGRKAVQAALDQAKREQDEKDKERIRLEKAERDRQQKELETAHKLNSDLERRYRKALIEDQSCAAWSKQLVSCPLQ
jgi:light-regulated signal transduction histidine kinase (bacteriophytochrome)